MEIRIDGIPIYLMKNKRQKIGLNLNHYRNLHYQTSNKLKKQMVEWISLWAIEYAPRKAKIKGPLCFTYIIYRSSKRRADLGNIGSIVDKFVSDALVECGLIEDDNTDVIKEIVFVDGGVSRKNPRADLIISKANFERHMSLVYERW